MVEYAACALRAIFERAGRGTRDDYSKIQIQIQINDKWRARPSLHGLPTARVESATLEELPKKSWPLFHVAICGRDEEVEDVLQLRLPFE